MSPLESNRAPGKKILHWARDVIEEAAASGYFSNLPGKGKPLDFSFEENPFIPADSRLAWRMLHSSGFSLPWIEARNDIDRLSERLERDLAAHLSRVATAHSNLERMPRYLRPSRLERLQTEQERFIERQGVAIDALNRKIDIHNLSVPIATLQIDRVDKPAVLSRLAPALTLEARQGDDRLRP